MIPSTIHNYNGQLYNQDFYINLTATDFSGTGIADIFYRINLGPTKRVSIDGQPRISTEGLYNVLQFWSRDNAGNQEQVQAADQIKLDKTGPNEIRDISDLNGKLLQSSHLRLIKIRLKDNILLANFINLIYFREGVDTSPQTEMLHLDTIGSVGIYSGTIDENPDPENYSVLSVRYWIEGTDAAGNIISIGGSDQTPFVQYEISDSIPFFKPAYQENVRTGQTITVKNLGITNIYTNGQTVSFEITLNKPTFSVSASFSDIDSEYNLGNEIILNVGGGIYRIYYQLSPSNTRDPEIDVTIPITATDGHNTSIDTSFSIGTTNKLSIISSIPNNRSDNLSIDTYLMLQFNDTILNDDLLTGHIYLTDSCNVGVPLDIDVLDNSLIINPVYRLRPSEEYILHINPGTPGTSLGPMDHYNELLFSTASFFAPLVPTGYSVTNRFDQLLTINDTSLKINNGKNVSITWHVIANEIFNGGDLRTAPILVSDNNSAVLWTDELKSGYTITPGAILEIKNLEIISPKIIGSENNDVLFYGGLSKSHVIPSIEYINNTLTISLNSVESIFVEAANIPSIIADGQNCFVRLTWCIPEDIEYGSAYLVRNTSHFPTNITDGTLIYQGRYKTWYDITVNGVLNFYRLFIFDSENKQYDFDVHISQASSKEWRVSYEYCKYEAGLIKKWISNCSSTAGLCNNAVRDEANNGNLPANIPVHIEYRLGKNKSDVENFIVSHCANKIEIEIDTNLAYELKNACDFFMFCECGAAADAACNESGPAIFMDITEHDAPCEEFRLIHATPVILK